jgi:branched-chain amino acid transport system ATP-binding protein
LAPILVDELLAALRQLIHEGLAAVIVEQNARKILGVTDRAVIIERGSLAHEAASETLRNDSAAMEKYLGIAAHSVREQAP